MSDRSAKSSSTSCDGPTSSRVRCPSRASCSGAALFLATLLWSGSAPAANDDLDPLALTNFLLGPQHSQWLVGAVGRIASEEERTEYLALDDDAAAAAFVERFWAKPGRDRVRRVFEERAEIADRRFAESAHPGRKTDRGAIFILYGEPEEITFEDRRHVDDPPVELWRYPKGAEAGLDASRPDRTYRFARRGDLTRLFRKGSADDPAVIRQRRPPNARLPSGDPPLGPP